MVIQRKIKARRLPIRKHQKPAVHVVRHKVAPEKWLQTAQMPDYLAEDHPEFCN